MADAIVRFDRVSFEYGSQKPIIREGSFSVRRGAKFTVMGQNGAGKSTLFQLITGALKPDEGAINIPKGLAIATARQVKQPPGRSFRARKCRSPYGNFSNGVLQKRYMI